MLPADKRNVYEPRVYVNSLQVEMEFNYRYGNMEQAYELWKAEEKKIISMEDEISVEMRMVLLLSASKVCWITGKYQDSNKILNKILHDTENEDLREDIWFSVYYMKMLNYFELGDDKGIAVAYKLFSRQYIDENSRSVAIPDANIIGFFRKNHKQLLTLKPDEKMLKKELNSLLENITSMQQLNTLKYYEPFYIWLFAKASKIPSLEAFSQFRVTTKEIEEGLLSGKSA
jgi:hypothetical protein